MKTAIGFDTSNYTTSVSLFGEEKRNVSRLLPVKEGSLGLRQSDAVFAHTNALAELVDEVFDGFDGELGAVGVSIAPRRVEGSYMPCFKVGELVAKSLATANGIPCYTFSHQEGHLAAAIASLEREELFESDFLAWHLSGGTSELLRVSPGLNVQKIGGTSDISAGQLIDRCGVMLGLKFPAGRELDSMARVEDVFKIKTKDLHFSLSGMENKAKEMGTDNPEKLAGFILGSVADVVLRTTNKAKEMYGNLPVLITGGVAGSNVIRNRMSGALFCEPKYSSDNAFGIAALAFLKGKLA